MLRKNLVLFLTFTICLSAISQTTTNIKVLQTFAQQHRIKEDLAYAHAVTMATIKGWPIRTVGKNGSVMALQYIDELGNPVYAVTFNNTIAAATTRANQLWPGGSSGLNLSGSSNAVKGKMGTWDGGLILRTHVEFAAGRILQKDSAVSGLVLDDHATHTTGTMIASGVNPIAKGMAFGLQQLIAYYGLGNDVSTMTTEAPNLILSNHSYGQPAGWYYDGTNFSWYGDTTVSTTKSYIFGWYHPKAQLYDSIAYNAPGYLMVFAAANSNGNYSDNQGPAVGSNYLYNGGTSKKRTAQIPSNPSYGSIAGGQTAKNILVVGAAAGLPVGYTVPGDVQIGNFSASGPTNDGRIKPDVVADGINVTSTSSASTTSYEAESGTSMAAPNTTGSLLLVQEYYNQKHGGTNFMRAATVKALAIHTADEAGSNPGPDFIFGYGLLDVVSATNVITSSYNNKTDTIIEKTLNSGTPYTINVVASGNSPIKATIAWTDPKGTVDNVNYLNTIPQLVHDLDLRVSSGSSTYLPWVLDPANPTAAATRGDDKLNNMEQVLVDSTVPGQTYTVTVSNKGSLARGSQAFSLIISGIGGTAYCTSVPSSNVGTRIDSVAFGGMSNKNTAGCKTYSNFTNLNAKIEPNQTLPVTVKVSSCDATTASKVVKVYIDYNNNGVFTDPGELVATSAVIAGTGGTFTTNITVPGNLTVGNVTLMRVVAQETTDTSLVKPCGAYSNGETQDYRVTIINPSNDLAVNQVLFPTSNGNCSNGAQYIEVAIRNKGSVNKSNVPLTAIVKNGSTTLATITGIHPQIIGNTNVTYTFQTPFPTVAGTTYTVIAYASATVDQNRANDTVTASITIAAKPSTAAGTAEICGSTVFLKVTSPSSSSNYFWYNTPTATSALAAGASTNTTVITSDKNYYLASGVRGGLGIATKNLYTSSSVVTGGIGGYQANGGNYMNYTSTVPVTLETARLFTGFPGQITFIAADIAVVNADGSYSYYPLASTTIDVYATKPVPLVGSQSVNDPTDTGAVFTINLPLPVGTHTIITTTDADATIFRNNNVTGAPYPFSIQNVITFTGNSATSTTDPNYYQNFYYYLYDMRFSSPDCVSDRATVAASTAPTPVISQVGATLSSSVTTGNQWSLNGVAIGGAVGQIYTPTVSGTYSVSVTDGFGCSRASANFSFVVTAVVNVSSTEIGLTATPNPSNGSFNVSFNVPTKADVTVELINAAGQNTMSRSYPGFSGKFSQQYSVTAPDGMYILKVQQNNKVYHQKLMILR